jgi:hypothetical protein
LKRRWERLLESIAHLRKLENILGLDRDISDKLTVLRDDHYLFQRYVETTMTQHQIKSEADFITKHMKGYNMFGHMGKIYLTTLIVGFFLAIIHVYPIFVLQIQIFGKLIQILLFSF